MNLDNLTNKQKDEIIKLAADFLSSLDLVFDIDWSVTKSNIEGIDEDATFLEPNVEDESNNWGNRGGFLARYRTLRDLMLQYKIPCTINYHPDEVFEKV